MGALEVKWNNILKQTPEFPSSNRDSLIEEVKCFSSHVASEKHNTPEAFKEFSKKLQPDEPLYSDKAVIEWINKIAKILDLPMYKTIHEEKGKDVLAL